MVLAELCALRVLLLIKVIFHILTLFFVSVNFVLMTLILSTDVYFASSEAASLAAG